MAQQPHARGRSDTHTHTHTHTQEPIVLYLLYSLRCTYTPASDERRVSLRAGTEGATRADERCDCGPDEKNEYDPLADYSSKIKEKSYFEERIRNVRKK